MIPTNPASAGAQYPPGKNELRWRHALRHEAAVLLLLCTFAINIFALALPILSLQVYDRVLIAQNESTLLVLATGVCVVVVIEFILRVARSYVIGTAGSRFEEELTGRAMQHIVHADLRHAMQYDTGEYVQQLSSIAKLRDFYNGQTLTLLIDLPFVGLFLWLVWFLAGGLVWVPIILLGLFLMVIWFTGRQVKQALRTRNSWDDKCYDFLIEALRGIHTVKSLGFENVFQRRYEALQSFATKSSYHLAEASSLAATMGSVFNQLMLLAVITAGAPMAVEGDISMGTLIACMLLTSRLMQPVQRLMGLWMRYQEIELAGEKLMNLYALPVHEVSREAHSQPSQGRLACENVTYTLPGEERPLLNNISFEIAPGECLALDSEDENAITALLELISGLYAPTSGSVKVDGNEACRYSSEALVQRVGYLATEGAIFRGTIMENLTQFQPAKEKAARETARALGIDHVIIKLPMGYETMLEGAAADPIPPGLRQRIAMARVLIDKPRLVLFFEADRSLDKEGHTHVYRALARLKGKATLILVTSDPNLLRLADRLIWLEEGTALDTPVDPYTPLPQRGIV